MADDRAMKIAKRRQEDYLAAFSSELRRLLDVGWSEQVAEPLAHSHAAHTLELQDARLAAAEATLDEALLIADAAAKIPRKRGGKARAANLEPAKQWLIDYWLKNKHTRRYPSKREFARKMAEPGSPFRAAFPADTVTARTIQVWLNGV
jgi:hypothetical protein